jgi:hypothetical protein
LLGFREKNIMSEQSDNIYGAPQSPAPEGGLAPRPSAIFYKRNELREMAWRMLAILLCLKLADYIAMMGRYWQSYAGMAWSIIPLLTTVAFIGYAYLQSRKYHELVDDVDNDNEVRINIVLLMQRVLFSVIGVYLIVTEAADFVLAAIHVYGAVGGLNFNGSLIRDAGGSIAFVAGVFLFFGANTLSRVWVRIRSFGT